MKIKRIFTAVLSFIMVLTMMPSIAFAEDGTTGDTELTGSMKLTKTAKLQEDGTYTIDLEAYSTGSTTTTQTTEKVPLDIVLVLDQSGSMDETMSGRTSRLTALKNAANSFIASVQTDAEQYSLNHKIAVVGFASGNGSESSTGWENTELLSTSSTVPYNSQKNATSSSITAAQYQEALVSANVNGTINSRLTTAVSRAAASGATYINYGLEMAKGVLDNRTETTYVKADGSVVDRKTVVIVFTDGVPGRYTDDRYGFQDDDEDDYNQISVANRALPIADEIKGSGTTIYSIGIFNGANPSANYNFSINTYNAGSWKNPRYVTYYNTATQAANAFLHFLSSDYTSAVNMTAPDRTTVVDNGYYLAASNADDLSEVFKGIAGSITESGTTVKLTADSVMKDIMADGFDASNANVEVTTFEAEMSDDGESVVKGNPTATANTLTPHISEDGKTVTVTGFDYSTKFVADEHPGEILHVTITGVIPTDDAVTGEIIGTNNEKSGIYENSEAADPAESFEMPNTILTEKSYVLDFGKKVSLAGVDQDLSVNAVVNTMKAVTASDNAVEGTYGNTNLLNDSIDYEPKTTNWNGYESFYVFGETSNSDIKAANANTDGYVWSKINIIPASNVYYEDDFTEASDTDSSVKIVYSNGWTQNGEAANDTQSSANITYGYDESYADQLTASNKTVHTSTSGATASFQFTGTGTDIYSYTDSQSGTVMVRLYKVGEDGTETFQQFAYCNNYAENGTYYTVPTVSFCDLEYGTYKVTLSVYSSNTGSIYYLDGIRIYNPLGTVTDDNSAVGEAYKEAGELNAKYTEIRSMLLSNLAETDGEGFLYIDNLNADTNEISVYESDGPEHEIYLSKGNAIAFTLQNFDPSQDAVYVGIKSAKGEASAVTVTNGTTGQQTQISVNSTMDQYYKITPDASGTVVIQNSGDGIVALTKVRTTSMEAKDITFRSTTETLEAARAFAAMPIGDEVTEPETDMAPVEDEEGTTEVVDENETVLDEDDVIIENPDQNEEAVEDERATENLLQEAFKNVFNSIFSWFWGR